MDNRAFSIDDDDTNGDKDRQDINRLTINNHRLSISHNQRLTSTSSDNNTNNDEAYEELTCTSCSTESQPINIRRPILYTQDFYNTNPSCHLSNCNNHSRCCSSVAGFVGDLFTWLWPFSGKLTQHSPADDCNESKCLLIRWLQSWIPILSWLPNYPFSKYLLSDVIAGCTILALHIPQGLAYGRLAGVDSIYGLYVSVFPVLIYSLFGTCRQVSIGTFAVISIACNDALSNFQFDHSNHTDSISTSVNASTVTPIDVLTTLALLVGIIQFLMGFFQLGILSIILSETLIQAFVTACSYHVFTSQIFALIDVDSKMNSDEYQLPLPFELVKSWIRFVIRIPNANVATVIVSVIAIGLLVICKFVLEPHLIARFKVKNLVIPIDILVIIVATVVSAQLDLNQQYRVSIIPPIPKAFEGLPKIPDVRYMNQLWSSAILITFVSYISTYSLGKIFAKQHNYQVSANQELIAIGAANIFSSFFLCYPCSGSLARSAVMNRVGARTQLASIVSSVLLVLFLLFFSSYLRTLPMAILSSIIVVALWGNMKQVMQIHTVWKTSKLDAILWTVTFWLVILFGIGPGLLYSIIFSAFILIIKLIIPIVKVKRQIKGAEVFVEINNMNDLLPIIAMNDQSINRWIVFEYQGPLLFINSIMFRRKFHQLIERYLSLINSHNNMMNNGQIDRKLSNKKSCTNNKDLMLSLDDSQPLSTIIFDCTRLTYIDQKGVETLLEVINYLKQFNIQMLIASCSKLVFDNLDNNSFFKHFNVRNCYMSVMDAIADLEHN